MEELYDIYEMLNSAADSVDSALWSIRQLPVGEDSFDKNEMIGEAEELLESLSKAIEEIGMKLGEMESRESEELKRDSYNW